jgi:uncharacterized protein YbjT (DUF2867 family)
MKIVVVGGTGLIGSKLVATLGQHGDEAVPASPGSGVNTLTGKGLDAALAGAAVVVDVTNAPSCGDAAMEFLQTSTRNGVADPEARYFGVRLGERTLLSGDDAILAKNSSEDWLDQAAMQIR